MIKKIFLLSVFFLFFTITKAQLIDSATKAQNQKVNINLGIELVKAGNSYNNALILGLLGGVFMTIPLFVNDMDPAITPYVEGIGVFFEVFGVVNYFKGGRALNRAGNTILDHTKVNERMPQYEGIK